jgi:hypothetical protein
MKDFFGSLFVCYTTAMISIKKIPHILFVIGILLVGFYGLILSVIAVFIQIFIILSYWKTNPTLKQTKKFMVGILLLVAAIILFGIGLYQRNSYFGGIGIIMWLAIGAVPFAISSFILLTIHTSPKIRK